MQLQKKQRLPNERQLPSKKCNIYVYIYIYIYLHSFSNNNNEHTNEHTNLGLAETEWKQCYYIRKIQHFLVIHETGEKKQVRYRNYHGQY